MTDAVLLFVVVTSFDTFYDTTIANSAAISATSTTAPAALNIDYYYSFLFFL